MQPVPMPELLDPHRLVLPERDDLSVDEHRDRSAALHAELERTCDYGQALWTQLQAVREYLAAAVPVDKDDDDAWQAWATAYGSTTSSLAGRTGDGGFGAEEAKVIAGAHRLARS